MATIIILKLDNLINNSEWGSNDSEDDFQKLVVANAKYKVMIFTTPTRGLDTALAYVTESTGYFY